MDLAFVKGKLIIALIFGAIFFSRIQAQVSYPAGSSVQYLKGSEAASLPVNWYTASYDDSGWRTGTLPLWYGDGSGGTLLDDMQGNYSSVYLRSTFQASQPELLEDLLLSIDYDDGFVIWINGTEVARRNAPAVLSYDGLATELRESGSFESIKVEPGSITLVEGMNHVAVQAFNIDLSTSTDFHFNLLMEAGVRDAVLEDTIGLAFNMASGFYEEAFLLQIEAAQPDWRIIYTLDGSNPQDSETAILLSSGKANIIINPASTNKRDATPAVTVRASSYVEGVKASFPESRTYIFLDRVMDQAYPEGGSWPTENVNGQLIDLAMDPDVVYSLSYRDEMRSALQDVPSLSVITDLDNLFDAGTGIYVNAWGHGYDWERECSVELINPGGPDGFRANAGLRIRGGWSRHNEFAKHSFRLFFRSEYGDAKLYFPLFQEEGTDRYDKVDLRSAQNYAWHRGDSRNTYLRDVFSRDTQGEMGQPYTRSRYYHLYLNGMYWGLYQTQERSEARYAADYLGGKSDEYDVIKVNTEGWDYYVEATDGQMDSWQELWNLCQQKGFENNADYFALEGKDIQGKPVLGGRVLVDIDNLIDYMMIIFYTGNFDSPTSSFGDNKGPNNFYAIYNREDPSQGYNFFVHDAEHSLFVSGADLGVDITEDRVNLADRTNGENMYVGSLTSFHPQWLHHKLMDNAEYRQRFIDRAYSLLNEDGVLTEQKNRERLDRRAAEIYSAIIGESARWGDTRTGSPLTRDQHWISEVEEVRNDFFSQRGNILIGQLKLAGLYPGLKPPLFRLEGNEIQEDQIQSPGDLVIQIENPNPGGSMYYTLDGTDPRGVGGSNLSDGAIRLEPDGESLEVRSSAFIRARTLYGSTWSAINELKVLGPQEDFTGLAITEIHYHPAELIEGIDTVGSKKFEFLEFKNTGEETLNLGGLVLDSAVYYEFPAGSMLCSGEFYVLASKPRWFYQRYGMHPTGNFQKNLGNSGEEILLEDAEGTPLMHFIYSDTIPWPMEADGAGYSLVSVDCNPYGGNPAEYSYWQASAEVGGSPFADDCMVMNEVPQMLSEADIHTYPNPTTGPVFIEWTGNEAPRDVEVSIYGINGTMLYLDSKWQGQGLDLAGLGLETGIYILRFDTGKQVYRKKIILRH